MPRSVIEEQRDEARKAMGRWAEMGRRLRYTGHLLWRSAVTPMLGVHQRPRLVEPDELGVTFIGHSSFLVQAAGQNLLFDPVFSTWLILLRRQRRPGVRPRDLPPIDVILLSHAHMDHLDRASLRRVVRITRRRKGCAPIVVVPNDVGDIVRGLGFSEVIELRWWESYAAGGLTITHTPAKHWGTRWIMDGHRGYGGYLVEGGARRLYYSGDTAYFAGFHEIGARLRPEVALLRIAIGPSIPARKTPCAPLRTLEQSGWCPCTTEPSGSPRSRWRSHCHGCLRPRKRWDWLTALRWCQRARRRSFASRTRRCRIIIRRQERLPLSEQSLGP
jgi:L-ascorbate metabolism protein UlaG (beta-lactamase superfamily)